jgi:hypothetical protein
MSDPHQTQLTQMDLQMSYWNHLVDDDWIGMSRTVPPGQEVWPPIFFY